MPRQSTIPRKSGGLQIDFAAHKSRQLKIVKEPHKLEDYSERVIDDLREQIDQKRDGASSNDLNVFATTADQFLDRWEVLSVGHSPIAYIERAGLFAAMLLDHRSQQFEARLNDDRNGIRAGVVNRDDSLAILHPNYKRLAPDEIDMATQASVLAHEWYQYLAQLLIRPPGPHLPGGSPSDGNSEPDPLVKKAIAEMLHCLPAGAFFGLSNGTGTDDWHEAGGRDECRKTLLCPHCHARSTTKLIGRVETGAWCQSRRRGKSLVLVRLAVGSEELQLDAQTQNRERAELGFDTWLRTSMPKPEHFEPISDGKIFRIERRQELQWTLTPGEVRVAAELGKRLMRELQRLGASGGLRFHAIGPKGRRYLHELSVVAEVPSRCVDAISERFGVQGRDAEFESIPVECVVVPGAYKPAARLLIAGSSWGFDLSAIGAELNQVAFDKCFSNSEDGSFQPRGLRGAAAWQPLWLFSIVSFWSRQRVLNRFKFKSHAAFGSWKDLLLSAHEYKSAVQLRRHELKNGPALDGRNRNPRYQLREKIKSSPKGTQARLAKVASLSRTAVSRFVAADYGSQDVVAKLHAAMDAVAGHLTSVEPVDRTLCADSVRSWLKTIERPQSWLAEQVGVSSSTVSRNLNGKSKMSESFTDSVARLMEGSQRRLAA